MLEIPALPRKIVPYPVVANIDFAEGPIFDEAGNLYFVNYLESGTLGRMTTDGTVSIWVHTGGTVNGLKYDGRGRIVAADHGGKRITRFDVRTRSMEILTADFQGEPYLGVNDVCLDHDGNIYFSDPGNGDLTKFGPVYKIDVDSKFDPVGVRRLADNLPYPNGLAIHPNQRRFFLATSGTNSILAYDITEDGNLTDQELIYQFPDPTVDGIQFDEYERLWIARWKHGSVDVLDVESRKLLRSYPMGGDGVTNMCWMGTSLYVTVAGRHSIERLDVGVRSANIVPK